MSGAHEALERAEHAAHSGHTEGHKTSTKVMGITMALIGVLIAYCAACVGSERNELTRTMIEQTEANGMYTSASTKFRLVMLELEKQRARDTGAAAAERSSVAKRLIRLYLDYSQERDVSKSWAVSYQPLIDAHFVAAESYERAQLIAEIGVVLASLGVLLASRKAWLLSVAFAVGCIGQLAFTAFHTKEQVRQHTTKVEHGAENFNALRKTHAASNADELTVDALDPGGKLRGELLQEVKMAEGGKEHAEAKKAH